MFLGYNTNGFAFHRLDDAVDILAEFGYRGVGITLDYFVLNPFDDNHETIAEQVRRRLDGLGMRCVVETGARFLLDARRKHQPTLVSATADERQRRIDFLERSFRTAEILGADCVSFWSGTADDGAPKDVQLDRLMPGLERLLRVAEDRSIPIAFEPEPSMLIETLADARPIVDHFRHPLFGLTVDIGHLHCQSEGSMAQLLESGGQKILNIHLDDAYPGKHEHLMFGEGSVDFSAVFAGLAAAGYSRGAYVELSRHSQNAVEVAKSAYSFLSRFA